MGKIIVMRRVFTMVEEEEEEEEEEEQGVHGGYGGTRTGPAAIITTIRATLFTTSSITNWSRMSYFTYWMR
jgi:hypothetical protein